MLFASPKWIKRRAATYSVVKCTIVDPQLSDGSCELVCKIKGELSPAVSRIDTTNDEQWYLGEGGDEEVRVNVLFDA
jgi:hypothetical protein